MSKSARRNFKNQRTWLRELGRRDEIRLEKPQGEVQDNRAAVRAGKFMRHWQLRIIEDMTRGTISVSGGITGLIRPDELEAMVNFRSSHGIDIVQALCYSMFRGSPLDVRPDEWVDLRAKNRHSPLRRARGLQALKNLRHLIRIWHSPNSVTSIALRGIRLAIGISEQETYDYILPKARSAKLFELFGRVSCIGDQAALFQWLVDRAKEGFDLSHRDLDWARLKTLTTRQKIALIRHPDSSARFQWRILGVSLTGMSQLTGPPPKGFATSTYLELQRWVNSSATGMDRPIYGSAYTVSTLTLTRLFGRDVKAAKCFVLRFHHHRTSNEERSIESLYHSAKQTLPHEYLMAYHDCTQAIPSDLTNGWKDFVLNHWRHPMLGDILAHADEVVEVVGRVPKSISEVRAAYILANRVMDFSLTAEEREFISTVPCKTYEACPNVIVRCGEYTLKKLAHDDPAQLTAGRLVGCCQHLGGAARDCAINAWKSGWCAIYAVYKNTDMVAQTFAWRTEAGSAIVFDSVESVSGVNEDVVLDMFLEAAVQIVGQLGISSVLVGDSRYGLTRKLVNRVSEIRHQDTSVVQEPPTLSQEVGEETSVWLSSPTTCMGLNLWQKPKPFGDLGYSDVRNLCFEISPG